MAHTTFETGHYKNIANFRNLIQFCTKLGDAYKPSRSDLELTQLEAKLTQAADITDCIKTAEAKLTTAVNNRATVFTDLRKQAARIVNTLEICNPSSGTIGAARHHLSKIRGKRIGTVQEPAAEKTDQATAKHRSVSQSGFDALTDHFEKLVHLVATEPAYQPNEAELTNTALQTKLQQLAALNTAVADASGSMKLLISERQHTLYDPVTGLTAIGQAVKKYVKVLYMPGSKEVKAVSAFSFRKQR